MPLGQRLTVTGVILMIVGETNGTDFTPVENSQHLLPDMGEAGVNKQITHEIGGHLETEHPSPPARDSNADDALTHLVGPDSGVLNRHPDSVWCSLPHLGILLWPTRFVPAGTWINTRILDYHTTMNIVKPNRVTRSYTQRLDAEPDQVFPLLCPVRESEWVNGWHPRLVATHSGLAELDCVFVTAAGPQEAIWVISRYEPDDHHLEIVKVIPGIVVGRIVIQLAAAPGGSTAEISYSFTSVGPDGDRVVNEFTQEHFDEFMLTWETELNHFIATGEMLTKN